jgi:cell division protein FtsB
MRRFSFPWRSILVVAGLFLAMLLVMSFNQRMADYQRMRNQLATVRLEATAVMQTQVALVTQVGYASSTEAVEEWAYEDSRWVRPGETLIILVPVGEPTPASPAAPPPVSTELPNWRIWWELFFGDH